ncbi:MAG: Gfo/Idh/MocA family oxidoreductase [Armatimonadetes bacterium]|nr:Gfo/Idh/MocA family oxidoreductase [Armatimonadota bacterium]MDW8122227.1 Gfo/Idh/MocA family oxidoreductase [Armatimonadota bacterium]
MQAWGIGIIGAGGIAGAHASAWLAHSEDCRLIAFADRDTRRAQERAEQFGADYWYDDPLALIERDDINVVSICTPPFNHAELATAALEAGKNVLVEKPMCCSLEEADKMIAAAQKAERLIGVVFQWRFTVEFLRMRALIEEGKLGRLLLVQAISNWWRTLDYYKVWWRGTWEKECGGSVMNHAIHHLDLLVSLVGDVERVCAEMGIYCHPIETEDAASALLRFRNRAIGVLVSSTAVHMEEHRLCLHGELGSVTMPWRLVCADARYQSELEEWLAKIPRPELGGHMAVVSDFLRALKKGEKPSCDGLEGRRSIELAVAIYKSAITGESVTLPISPYDPFYRKEALMNYARG